MHSSDKCDPDLGRLVNEHMISLGLETPLTNRVHDDAKNKIIAISTHMTEVLKTLGLDLSDDSLMDTPNRIAKMYVNEIFYGLDYSQFPKCTTIENKMGKNSAGSFVVERNINVQSNCEHHFVVIDGKAAVAYIPRAKVLGLSKLNRIVEFYAKRPQVQERLTEQIAAAIAFVSKAPDFTVYLDAVHYCVKSRGIQDQNSATVTLSVGGSFAAEGSEVRKEFLNLARSS